MKVGRTKTFRSTSKNKSAADNVKRRRTLYQRKTGHDEETKHKKLQELAAQMRGLDHPEVADLAAVSAAVGRLRDAAGSASPHLRCVEAAAKYIGHVLENPSVGKVSTAR